MSEPLQVLRISSLAFDEIASKLAAAGEKQRLSFDVHREAFVDMGGIAIYAEPRQPTHRIAKLTRRAVEAMTEGTLDRTVDGVTVRVLGVNLQDMSARVGVEWLDSSGESIVEIAACDVPTGETLTLIGIEKTLTFRMS